jgi:hypothetical protein
MTLDERDSPRFKSDDVDVLEAVIALVPDLDAVARTAVILRRKRAKYPIDSLADLFAHVAVGKLALLGERKITLEQAGRFFPKEFFPIASEQDLLVKLYLAFHRGTLTHEREDAPPAPSETAKADQPAVRIQGPAPLSE